MEKCHIQLLRYNCLRKLASGLPDHDVVVLDEQAKMVKSIRVQHSAQGLDQLDAFLQQISGPDNKEQVACIIETNQGLLISMLLEKGWPIYPVNPRTVDRHRSPSGAKTDHIDAYWAFQDRTR